MKIDIGCGEKKKTGFIGIDLVYIKMILQMFG
jgi:hypothetical protein